METTLCNIVGNETVFGDIIVFGVPAGLPTPAFLSHLEVFSQHCLNSKSLLPSVVRET